MWHCKTDQKIYTTISWNWIAPTASAWASALKTGHTDRHLVDRDERPALPSHRRRCSVLPGALWSFGSNIRFSRPARPRISAPARHGHPGSSISSVPIIERLDSQISFYYFEMVLYNTSGTAIKSISWQMMIVLTLSSRRVPTNWAH